MERTIRVPPVTGRKAIRGPKRLLALRADSRLVDLVRRGDEAAFEVLYERHAAGVLGFCRHMLGSQEEAEDAAQQAFVAAYGAIGRGSREIAFKPWIYTIARNRCLSMLRARRDRPAELSNLSTAGLNEQVEQRADLRELVQDVQRLPEQQRAALLLSELEDLSHAEVGEVIGVEPKKVKGLVFRARSTLAERRAARAAACDDIRPELASAKGGALRRGRLRYHLESCPGCVAYLEEVRRQRRLLGIALPVVPTLALKESVLVKAGASLGAGGAAGAATTGGGAGLVATSGTGAATAGGALLGGTAAKVAIAGALLVGGAGVTAEVARERSDAPSPAKAPVETRQAPRRPAQDQSDAVVPARGTPPARAMERRRGAERRTQGQQRAVERGGGRAAGGDPPGKALGRGRTDEATRGQQGRERAPGQVGRQDGGNPAGAGPPVRTDPPATAPKHDGAGRPGGGVRAKAPRAVPAPTASPPTPGAPVSPGPTRGTPQGG